MSLSFGQDGATLLVTGFIRQNRKGATSKWHEVLTKEIIKKLPIMIMKNLKILYYPFSNVRVNPQNNCTYPHDRIIVSGYGNKLNMPNCVVLGKLNHEVSYNNALSVWNTDWKQLLPCRPFGLHQIGCIIIAKGDENSYKFMNEIYQWKSDDIYSFIKKSKVPQICGWWLTQYTYHSEAQFGSFTSATRKTICNYRNYHHNTMAFASVDFCGDLTWTFGNEHLKDFTLTYPQFTTKLDCFMIVVIPSCVCVEQNHSNCECIMEFQDTKQSTWYSF